MKVMNYISSMNKSFNWRTDRSFASILKRPTAFQGAVNVQVDTTTNKIINVVDMPQNTGNYGEHQQPYSELKTRMGAGRRLTDRRILMLQQENAALRLQNDKLRALLKARSTAVADPLAAAVTSGAAYMREEFSRPENLSLESASDLCGRSERTINQERNRGWLYALLLEGNKRGYRYPKWQFDVKVARLRPILDILRSKNFGAWAIHNFLMTSHPDLDDLSPSAAIADEAFPLERIENVARIRVDPHQGAT